ncbi:MAG: DUF4410 domain-containing protein [Alphaproteobacteria bacterium]|nr:DUF4410 domain-containing protein [Alphaproteobacteria bacterium]
MFGILTFIRNASAPQNLTRRVQFGRQAKPHGGLTKSLALAAIVVVTGCTTSTITPDLVTKPPQTYGTVVVGDITLKGELWQNLVPHFKDGMLKTLKESDAFANAVVLSEGTPPSDAIIVSGEITNVDEGNAAARAIIGFGAGRARAGGSFNISDSEGVALARFGARQAYSGGAGIGGFNLLSMEQLLSKLGEATAGSVIRWSKGEPLEPPREE